jgi:hypothetical protein
MFLAGQRRLIKPLVANASGGVLVEAEDIAGKIGKRAVISPGSPPMDCTISLPNASTVWQA